MTDEAKPTHPYVVNGKQLHLKTADGREGLTVQISVTDTVTGERVDYLIPGVLVAAFALHLELAIKAYPTLTGEAGTLRKVGTYTVPMTSGANETTH